MLKHTPRPPAGARKSLTVFVAALLTIGTSMTSSTLAQNSSSRDGWVLTVPTRRAPDTPPAGPPALPAGAESITPATIDIVLSRDGKTRQSPSFRQTVSRTVDRIHLAGTDGREWLFERNPVDRRRVSATLVEHSSKAIVLYEETDLRMALGIRGWVDVLALGFDTELLSRCRRTDEIQTVAGIRFSRYASVDKGCSVDDVSWNEEQALPGRFVMKGESGVTRFEVARGKPGADASLLRPAIPRFPTYRVFDLADWLEKH